MAVNKIAISDALMETQEFVSRDMKCVYRQTRVLLLKHHVCEIDLRMSQKYEKMRRRVLKEFI